jgi:hypothetical protein
MKMLHDLCFQYKILLLRIFGYMIQTNEIPPILYDADAFYVRLNVSQIGQINIVKYSRKPLLSPILDT